MTVSLVCTSLYCAQGVIRKAHHCTPSLPPHTLRYQDCLSTGPVGISPEMRASPCSVLSITGYYGHVFALRSFLHPAVINGCFQNYWHLPGQGTLIECSLGCQRQCLARNVYFFIQWSHASCAGSSSYDICFVDEKTDDLGTPMTCSGLHNWGETELGALRS